MSRRKGRAVPAVLIFVSLACVLALAGCQGSPTVPVSLTVSQTGMVKTGYSVGEAFNVEGVVATVVMSDGSVTQIPAGELTYMDRATGRNLPVGHVFTADDVGDGKAVRTSYRGLDGGDLTITVKGVAEGGLR